jgi:hypothetical protein
MMQTSQTAITNARRSLMQRLARWILMAHDRSQDSMIPLTHEFLSLMLGVRRAGVTETLQILKQQKLIETGRNLIVVRNRGGLQKNSGSRLRRPRAGIPPTFRVSDPPKKQPDLSATVQFSAGVSA